MLNYPDKGKSPTGAGGDCREIHKGNSLRLVYDMKCKNVSVLMAMRTFFLTAKGWLSGKSTFSMSNLGVSLQGSLSFVHALCSGYTNWQTGQSSLNAAKNTLYVHN